MDAVNLASVLPSASHFPNSNHELEALIVSL